MATTNTWNVSNVSDIESTVTQDDNVVGEEDYMYYDDSYVGIVPKVPYLCIIYIIVILGLIGNVLVFVLMQHPWYRRMSYSVYLRFLAVCDTFYLLTSGSEDIIDHQLGTTHIWSLALCIPWDLVNAVSRFASPWLIVCISVDRFVAIVIPLKRSSFCSLKVALSISIGLMLVIITESAAIVAHTQSLDNGTFCESKGSAALYDYISVSYSFFQSTFPCFLILIFNIFTIVAIKRGRKFRQSFRERDGENRRPAVDKVTISLILVSLTAFFTLVPLAILETAEILWKTEYENAYNEALARNDTEVDIPEPVHLIQVNNVWPLLNLIQFLNFAQNFYVMIFTGSRYRKALRSYACTKCRSSPEGGNNVSKSTQDVRLSTLSVSQQTNVS